MEMTTPTKTHEEREEREELAQETLALRRKLRKVRAALYDAMELMDTRHERIDPRVWERIERVYRMTDPDKKEKEAA